jgi:endonuclease/exonuclease/phosphatase (EEP) superfamily protein YafD
MARSIPVPPLPKRKHSSGGWALLVWLYVLAVIGAALLIQRLSDDWWPATLLLFAPRWIWALPLLVLVPAALWRRPRLLWPLAATVPVLLVGVMGFVLPTPAKLRAPEVQTELRVLTYNIGGGEIAPAAFAPWLESQAVDVAVFQECEYPIEQAKAGLAQAGWKVELQHGSCMVSRHPIRKVEVRDPREIWKMGGSGVIVRYEVATPSRVVTVINVHLETVREGLTAVMQRGLGGASEMESNIDQRDIESVLARAFANQTSGPLIVAGDFNMPVESAIYRAHWGEFTNAFSCAGWGFGATKATRWHGIRIDHVLLGPGWSCAGAQIGADLGLDHRPVVVDLRWHGMQ